MEVNTQIQEELEQSSTLFVQFLCDVLGEIHTPNINMVGIGNSISGGWTAIDNNVQPQLEKLHPFLDEKCAKARIHLNLASFVNVGENSNQRIYSFLAQNPSLHDVKEDFEYIFDSWKKKYNGTPFENYVDKKEALKFYFDSDVRFKDFYRGDTLTITNFNGCTGEFLENGQQYTLEILRNKWTFLDKEIEELKKTIQLVTSLSDYSYMTIGNFPYLTKNYLFINNLIERINQRIQKETSISDRLAYFNKVKIEFINRFNGNIKLDNHPSLPLQYETLSEYLLFLISTLPEIMALKNKETIKKKYDKEKALVRTKMSH